jgi:alkanesulfonate monooxygenase SsuD/methylene tetrahydromethanopterin reductase-like flavin-dependent oxidoreductase (luciferase family)
MPNTPLAVLDLVPISSGSTAAQALRNSTDLARQAERLGYARFWVAEHHLNPGVASTSPAVVLALTAAATSTIRIGSGAVQMGHRTALSTVEEFGLIDALYPGRLDLGLGRSGGRPRGQRDRDSAGQAGAGQAGAGQAGTGHDGAAGGDNSKRPPKPDNSKRPGEPDDSGGAGGRRLLNGLLLPPLFIPERALRSPRTALSRRLLTLPQAQPQDYTEQVADVLALLRGSFRADNGTEAHVVPGEGADVQVWILGSSGGESARVAGGNGLRFAANYHISPATVLEAADGYRAAFRPSAELDRPYVSVSADVVVADDEGKARELAAGYGPWVRSIRTGAGAIEFPTPAEARALPWDDEDRALVADRLATQFVGTPAGVADRLEQLRDAAGADELIITTITHDHADRVRSYELLMEEWAARDS